MTVDLTYHNKDTYTLTCSSSCCKSSTYAAFESKLIIENVHDRTTHIDTTTVASSIREEVCPACGLALRSLLVHHHHPYCCCCLHAQPELVTLQSSRVRRVSHHPHPRRKTNPVREEGWGMGSQPTGRLAVTVGVSVLWVFVVSSHRIERHCYNHSIAAVWMSFSQSAPVMMMMKTNNSIMMMRPTNTSYRAKA